jgi:hypothetical protein
VAAPETEIVTLGPESEVRQAPEQDEMWQDSVVLCWWDLESSVGGYHRIGHQPLHRDGPRAHLSSAFFTADRVLKRNESVPLRDEDRLPSGGFGWGGGACTFELTDHPVWTFRHDDASGELHLSDFHSPVDIYPKSGQLAERITSGHLEAGAGVAGQLTIGGERHQVDGLAFRDHGWGTRHWNEVLAHRWVAATFGSEATVLAISVLSSDGHIADFGCVIRGDDRIPVSDVDIVTYLERDGLTHRGGHVRMVLPDGEIVEMDAEVLQKAAVFWMADQFAINETMCRITWGDRVGICNFEVSNNPAAGRSRPVAAINGVVEDGLHAIDRTGAAGRPPYPAPSRLLTSVTKARHNRQDVR